MFNYFIQTCHWLFFTDLFSLSFLLLLILLLLPFFSHLLSPWKLFMLKPSPSLKSTVYALIFPLLLNHHPYFNLPPTPSLPLIPSLPPLSAALKGPFPIYGQYGRSIPSCVRAGPATACDILCLWCRSYSVVTLIHLECVSSPPVLEGYICVASVFVSCRWCSLAVCCMWQSCTFRWLCSLHALTLLLLISFSLSLIHLSSSPRALLTPLPPSLTPCPPCLPPLLQHPPFLTPPSITPLSPTLLPPRALRPHEEHLQQPEGDHEPGGHGPGRHP